MKTIYLYSKTTRYSFHITASYNDTAPKGYKPLAITKAKSKLLALLNFLPEAWHQHPKAILPPPTLNQDKFT
jgi:hypothetical protein